MNQNSQSTPIGFFQHYLKSVRAEFIRYKTLGDKSFEQLSENDITWKLGVDDNSISQIVKHMSGNMMSRWTHFLTEDGEKVWRERDQEFIKPFTQKTAMLSAWEKGWNCLFDALDSLNADNFTSIVKIRGESHSVIEAINRQLAHYSGHVGQIVLLAKMIKGRDWESLSIPKGESDEFNKNMFGQ